MKFQALILAAALSIPSSAYAVNVLNHTDTLALGSFGAPVTYVDSFSVASAGAINHSLTFSINTPLYAGSGISDIPVSVPFGSFTLEVFNINGLNAKVFDSNNVLYAQFIQNGDADHLTLPASSYFATGNYTLKVTGTALGSSGGLYSVAAVTVPVPEPETWAMLLVGLGLVGFRLRQKHAASKQETFN